MRRGKDWLRRLDVAAENAKVLMRGGYDWRLAIRLAAQFENVGELSVQDRLLADGFKPKDRRELLYKHPRKKLTRQDALAWVARNRWALPYLEGGDDLEQRLSLPHDLVDAPDLGRFDVPDLDFGLDL